MSSQLRVDKILPVDGAPTGGGGGIIQVVQAVVSVVTFNTTSTSKVDITGMSVSITPKFNTSKILISSHLTYGSNNYNFYCDLLRDSTVLGAPSSLSLIHISEPTRLRRMAYAVFCV